MRTRLTAAAAALPAANIVHALVPAPGGQNEAIAGPIMGTVLTVSALVALAALVRRRAWAPALAAATGIATIAGFALFHAIPAHTEVTEPYWGHHGTTNAAQVTSLVLIGMAAAWVTVEALAALSFGREPAEPAPADRL
jgi:hypothetical protein